MTAAILIACLAAAMPAATSGALGRTAAPRASARAAGLPRGFFGISPQTLLSEADIAYMKAGGIESVRWPMIWPAIQPTADGGYDWSSFDQTLAVAARAGLQVLPSIGGTPRWLARKETTFPINNSRARGAWTAFLRAAVGRYGPGGEFWAEHSQEGVNYEPAIPNPTPIRAWQVWNEPNFFYFAYPVAPRRYARLVKISNRAIKAADPGAKVLLAGLFGEPTAKGRRGMPAARFLSAVYRTPGIKRSFDGVALHPYAADTETLEELVEALHEVTAKNRDRRTGLYVTEIGWGSQNNYNQVAYEQGIRGQVRQLRGAYRYLIANRSRLNLKQVDWFSWKDISGACNFCDSVGLFHAGPRFRPKPAWHAFVRIAGGRPRP